MTRVLFPVIGYLCTATVLAVTLGLGYLIQSGQLTDEKVFRAVALLHNVDLAQIAADLERSQEAIPIEEESLAEQVRRHQLLDRNMEVKMLALDRGRQEFQNLLRILEDKTTRFDRQAKEIQDKLVEQRDLVTKESIEKVVSNLQLMPPENAKFDLLTMMKEERTDDVIRLWKAMRPDTRKQILETFEDNEELTQLHELHRLMMEGYPDKAELENAIQDLEKFSSSEF